MAKMLTLFMDSGSLLLTFNKNGNAHDCFIESTQKVLSLQKVTALSYDVYNTYTQVSVNGLVAF